MSRDHIEDVMFALKVRHKALKRNRRCLLAYLYVFILRFTYHETISELINLTQNFLTGGIGSKELKK